MEESSHIVLGDQYEKTMDVIIGFIKRRFVVPYQEPMFLVPPAI
jgi:hypothetical protein